MLLPYYAKHISGIVVPNLKEQIEDTYYQIPQIKERISILQNIEALGDYEEKMPKVFGKAVADYVNELPWQLMHVSCITSLQITSPMNYVNKCVSVTR